MDLPALWTRFRKTPWFRITYLLLVSLLGGLMLATALACFGFILIPVIALAVPHLFGERKVRNHLANGMFCVIMIAVIYTAIAAPAFPTIQQQAQAASVPGTAIQGGLVTPFGVSADQTFTFSANVTSTDDLRGTFTVRVQFVDLGAAPRFFPMNAVENQNLTDGERFEVTVPIEPTVHQFNFQVVRENGTALQVVVQTPGSWGPMDAPFDVYLSFIFIGALFGTLYLGFFFLLVLLLYWWTRKAKDIRGRSLPEPAKRAEGGGEFTCTNCGADVSESDAKCPNCGASFESGAEREAADAKA